MFVILHVHCSNLCQLIGLEPKERLNRQQKLLRKRLGLDIAPGIDVGMDKLFDDEDLLINAPETKVKSLTKQKSFEVRKTKRVCVWFLFLIAIEKETKKLQLLVRKK